MGCYNILVPQVGYLANVTLKCSSANGVTQADLDLAERRAAALIDEALGGIYDTSAWQEETPAVIERVADMFSSGLVLRQRHARGDARESDDLNLAEILGRNARVLLGMIRRGALGVVDTGGRTQKRLRRPASAHMSAPPPEVPPPAQRHETRLPALRLDVALPKAVGQ